MRIIVAGGGSGGHITPNIAILELLKTRIKKLDVLYIGSKNGMEKELIPDAGWNYRAISCGKLRRYFSWENFLDVFRTAWGVLQSLWIILRYKPDVIFCKGGYVSLPVAVAGGILRNPVIIHESDLEMGLANRIATRFARKICVSFPETLEKLASDKRVVFTGNPVRWELLSGVAQRGYELCDFKDNKPVLLVMGGSQGAWAINNAIRNALPRLLKTMQVVHLCGRGNMDRSCAREGYFQVEYLGPELKDVYAITELMVSRAGANSLAEMDALHLPAILVPLTAGSSRGDQICNAQSFVKNHPALVLPEARLTENDFDFAATIIDFHAKHRYMSERIKSDRKSSALNFSPAALKIVELIVQLSSNQ